MCLRSCWGDIRKSTLGSDYVPCVLRDGCSSGHIARRILLVDFLETFCTPLLDYDTLDTPMLLQVTHTLTLLTGVRGCEVDRVAAA